MTLIKEAQKASDASYVAPSVGAELDDAQKSYPEGLPVIYASQVEGLAAFIENEMNALEIDGTVEEEDVTQHQSALQITEAQITDLRSYALAGHTHAYGKLTGKPDLFSGVYSELTGKPVTFSDLTPAEGQVAQYTGGQWTAQDIAAGGSFDGIVDELLTVKALSGQTEPMTQWLDPSGNPLLRLGADGVFRDTVRVFNGVPRESILHLRYDFTATVSSIAASTGIVIDTAWDATNASYNAIEIWEGQKGKGSLRFAVNGNTGQITAGGFDLGSPERKPSAFINIGAHGSSRTNIPSLYAEVNPFLGSFNTFSYTRTTTWNVGMLGARAYESNNYGTYSYIWSIGADQPDGDDGLGLRYPTAELTFDGIMRLYKNRFQFKGTDGNFYEIDVDENQNIIANQIELTHTH